MERIVLVDDKDNEIGVKDRGALDDDVDIYRATGLWIVNSKGDVLLAQRGFSKRKHPGKWGPAVAGTVDEGESYEENIVKEAEEEIGLRGYEFVKGEKKRVRGEYNYFRQMFLCTTDMKIEDFVIQEEELAGLKWFDKDDLERELKENPDKFVPVVGDILRLN